MPFDHLDDDTDMYGRKVWTCRGCGLQTVKESDIGPHVCEASELGKTTPDDEADKVLEAVQERMAAGMEVYSLQREYSMLLSLLKTTGAQARLTGERRSSARSQREAGEIAGRIAALSDQEKMYQAMMKQVREELGKRGVDA